MRKTEILFDASPMVDSQKTGVGYYVDQLIKNIGREYGNKNNITGYYFDFMALNHKHQDPVAGISFQKIWLVPGKLLSLCRKLGFQPFLEFFIFKKSAATLFTNYVSIPQINRTHKSLVVYDLGFLDCPEYIQKNNLSFLSKFCPPSIQSADSIITISEFTKSRIKHYFPDIKAPIVVTHIPPANFEVQKVSLTKRLNSFGIRKNGYLLFVGTIEPRKNIDTLVDAYCALDESIRKNYSLVLAGGSGWDNERMLQRINALKRDGFKILLTGYVTDEEKVALYTNASAFVLASHYEGFGMPILEAMQFKLPVILSDIPVFHEVAGDAAAYFNKDSSTDLSILISAVLNDKTLRKKLVNKSEGVLDKFSWTDNAKRVYELITGTMS